MSNEPVQSQAFQVSGHNQGVTSLHSLVSSQVDDSHLQGLKSIGIAGSAIPGGQAFGRKEGAFPCGAKKVLGILIARLSVQIPAWGGGLSDKFGSWYKQPLICFFFKA